MAVKASTEPSAGLAIAYSGPSADRPGPMRLDPPDALMYWLVRGWMTGWRYRIRGVEQLRAAVAMSDSGAVVGATWHQSLAAIFGPHGPLHPVVLTSRSRDGTIMDRLLHRFGYQTVRGSSHRGAIGAAKGLNQHLRHGAMVALTVDGPTGPFKVPKDGALALAQRLRLPLVPVAARASHELVFKRSWDRFRLPMPLCTIHLEYGEPWLPGPDLEVERRRLALALHALEAAVSLRAGHTDQWPRPQDTSWLA